MKTTISGYWRGIASGTRTSTADLLFVLLLAPFGKLYALVQQARAGLYNFGALKTQHLPRPVVSIGNLTVGGTGKTPVTSYIARQLISHGRKVAVLSRGYGGSLEGQCVVVSDGATVMAGPAECGDEPYLLATAIPGLVVVTGADRYAAGMLAMEQFSPDIFLLDDGFQHLRLHRNLDIMLLDHSRPFGNGRTIPAGLLREPASAIRRADLIITTRCPEGATVSDAVNGTPTFAATHRLTEAVPLGGGDPSPLETLCGSRILAFAGIAQPEFFFAGLRNAGLNVVDTLSFADHVHYDESFLAEICEAMRASGANCAVTTEKDGVKLKLLPHDKAAVTYVARLDIDIDKPADLLAHILNLLPIN